MMQKTLKKFCLFLSTNPKTAPWQSQKRPQDFWNNKKFTKFNFTKSNWIEKSERKTKPKTPISTNDQLFYSCARAKNKFDMQSMVYY